MKKPCTFRMDPELEAKAKARALELNLSLSGYVCKLIAADLSDDGGKTYSSRLSSDLTASERAVYNRALAEFRQWAPRNGDPATDTEMRADADRIARHWNQMHPACQEPIWGVFNGSLKQANNACSVVADDVIRFINGFKPLYEEIERRHAKSE